MSRPLPSLLSAAISPSTNAPPPAARAATSFRPTRKFRRPACGGLFHQRHPGIFGSPFRRRRCGSLRQPIRQQPHRTSHPWLRHTLAIVANTLANLQSNNPQTSKSIIAPQDGSWWWIAQNTGGPGGPISLGPISTPQAFINSPNAAVQWAVVEANTLVSPVKIEPEIAHVMVRKNTIRQDNAASIILDSRSPVPIPPAAPSDATSPTPKSSSIP